MVNNSIMGIFGYIENVIKENHIGEGISVDCFVRFRKHS